MFAGGGVEPELAGPVPRAWTKDGAPLYDLCWEQDPGALVACDRARDHSGFHSWEPWGRRSGEVTPETG